MGTVPQDNLQVFAGWRSAIAALLQNPACLLLVCCSVSAEEFDLVAHVLKQALVDLRGEAYEPSWRISPWSARLLHDLQRRALDVQRSRPKVSCSA